MVVLNVWVTTSVISLSIVLIIYSLHTSLLLFRTEPNGALDTTIKWWNALEISNSIIGITQGEINSSHHDNYLFINKDKEKVVIMTTE